MARRKTAKGNAKRHSTNNIFALTYRMEKEFLGTPIKINSEYSKHISTLKQKENKLKSALNKSKTQTKTSENRIKAANKVKTPTGRKQLIKAKKAHSKLLKNHTVLNKQLDDVSKSLTTAISKQAKVAALRKYLGQFEKQWNQSTKKLKAKGKKTKLKRKTSTSKSRAFPQVKQQPQPDNEKFENIDNEIRVDEEITS